MRLHLSFEKRLIAAGLAPLVFFTTFAPVAAFAQEPPRDAVPQAAEPGALVADVRSPVVEGVGDVAHPEVVQEVRDGEHAPPTGDSGGEPLSLPGGPGKSAVTPQAISLPNAEGSIEGMGESFSPVLSSGTATFTVPVALPPGRAGVQPSLALSYSSSGGNDVLGIGWSMAVPYISRQTDRGLPRYVDAAAWTPQEDRFFYNGGQELVPVESTADVDTGTVPTELEGWQQYRARVEGAFMRFFRHYDSRSGQTDRWVVQSKDGTRFDFGLIAGSLPSDYGDTANSLVREEATGRIFRWSLVRMSDAHGSTVYYRYTRDRGQVYLQDIHYVSPATCAGSSAASARECTEPLSNYGRRVRIRYEPRSDAVATYISGWRVQTAQRVHAIDVTAVADGTVGNRTFVRRYHLSYDVASFYSLLTSVQVEGRPNTIPTTDGYRVGDATVSEAAVDGSADILLGDRLPPMTFGYTQPTATTAAIAGFGGFDFTVHDSPASPPHSVDEARTDFFDVNSDGLPDIITTDPARYRMPDGSPAVGVFFNGFSGSGAAPGVAGGFSEAVPMPMRSDLSGVMTLSNLNIVPMDIDGDGRSDLLHMPRLANYGYFTPTRGGPSTAGEPSPAYQGWQWAYVPVALPTGDTNPRIDLGRDGEHIKVFDVNNDHLVDVVRTTGTEMQTWLNLGWVPLKDASGNALGDGRFGHATYSAATGWALSTQPISSCLLTEGLPLDFNDPETQLADMNGDGLQDIVKIRRGRVYYWAGRGPGLWGEGDGASCASGLAAGAGRIYEMATPPAELNPDLDGVYLQDVNEDGAADVVQVRFNNVDVWINQAGLGFTPRITATDTPFTPAFAPRIRFADIDGSGTTDIVWGNADRYQWVDPMGGRRPRLLVSVDNGLGALTTMQYGSSAEEYLRDLAASASCRGATCSGYLWGGTPDGCDAKLDAAGAGCQYRSAGSPVVSTVVTSVSTTDRFNVLGREENVTTTNFRYHQGYYEGIEQEFRGFGVAEAEAVGDASYPTSTTRTEFYQGRRPNSIATQRLTDNPDEALKGRERLTEVMDEAGRVLSTTYAEYTVRKLFDGENGYRVSYAFVGATHELRYDLMRWDPSGATTLSLPDVRREHADGTGVVVDDDAATAAIPVRSGAYAWIKNTTDTVDNAGNLRQQTAWGRVQDEYGPGVEVDANEAITSYSTPELLSSDGSGWLWRTESSQIADASFTGPATSNAYTTVGDLKHSSVVIAPPTGVSYDFGDLGATPTTQTVESSTLYDAWGNAVESCGGGDISGGGDPSACLRRGTVTYGDGYAQFPVTETVFTDHEDTDQFLTTSAIWDEGLGVLVSATDPNSQTTSVTYDGLGRLTSMTPPVIDEVSGDSCTSATPTTYLDYDLTTSPASQPASRVHAVTRLSCSNPDAKLEAYSYVDGLGRVRASLATGDSENPWIQSGVTVMSRRGSPVRAYHPAGVDSPGYATALARPGATVPHTDVVYDAFGRERAAIAEDGSRTWTHYHATSMDVCDPLDDDPSDATTFRTCTTTRMDGHGRTIDQTLRNRQPDATDSAIEADRLWSYYRADGALVRLIRAKTDDADGVVRSSDGSIPTGVDKYVYRDFTYDGAGRRIGATDRDTDSRTNGDAASKTWRYLFNEVGDLAAVRDPRGCGQDFYYDLAGRLLGEHYVTCGEAQPSGENPLDTVPAGAIGMAPVTSATSVDVRYFFDADPGFTNITVPTSYAHGRATGVADRGQRSAVAYDARGNAIWTGRQMALLPAAIGLTGSGDFLDEDTGYTPTDRAYDEESTHTYERTAKFDHANRPASMVLPTDPDFDGAAPVVGGELTYDGRGLPDSASVTIGGYSQEIVHATHYRVDGLVDSVEYGDARTGHDATVSTTSYDARLRPTRMRTTRDATGMSGLAAVTVPFDQTLVWDAASNLTRILDGRVAAEWAAGHKPQDVTVTHDALYRVTDAMFAYHAADDGTVTVDDDGSDWRTDMAATRAVDPMSTHPAPMLPTAPMSRVQNLTWSFDWLGNMTDWSDDAHAFYERSIGAITNGEDVTDGRPSALYAAVDIDDATHTGGYLSVEYGEGGNVTAMDVHAQCESGTSTCTAASPEDCVCAAEQHYEYRWDEVNRLAEARRYDKVDGTWKRKVRQRMRYDSTNQRTIKEVIDEDPDDSGTLSATIRATLYVYPGDFERRGMAEGESTYDAITAQTETQYLVGAARVVWQATPSDETTFDRTTRITAPIADLLGTTSANLDLRTGALLEASTYYPNGGRETYETSEDTAPEPHGFSGKEGDEEIGLTFFGERYLAGSFGRWVSPDPLSIHRAQGGDPLNAYHYVTGNLLASRDRNGLTLDAVVYAHDTVVADSASTAEVNDVADHLVSALRTAIVRLAEHDAQNAGSAAHADAIRGWAARAAASISHTNGRVTSSLSGVDLLGDPAGASRAQKYMNRLLSVVNDTDPDHVVHIGYASTRTELPAGTFGRTTIGGRSDREMDRGDIYAHSSSIRIDPALRNGVPNEGAEHARDRSLLEAEAVIHEIDSHSWRISKGEWEASEHSSPAHSREETRRYLSDSTRPYIPDNATSDAEVHELDVIQEDELYRTTPAEEQHGLEDKKQRGEHE